MLGVEFQAATCFSWGGAAGSSKIEEAGVATCGSSAHQLLPCIPVLRSPWVAAHGWRRSHVDKEFAWCWRPAKLLPIPAG